MLLGKGDGSFEEPPGSVVGPYAAAVATGDFTGNGNLGVAVVNQGSDSVTILPGNGDGTFQQPLTVALPPGSGATSVVAADFNNDGRTDLAVTDSSLDEVSILLGNGDGTFQSSTVAVPARQPVCDRRGRLHRQRASSTWPWSIATRARSPSSSATATARSPSGRRSRWSIPTIPPIRSFSRTPSWPATSPRADTSTWPSPSRSSTAVTVLLGDGNGTFTQGSTISFGESFPFVPQTMSLVAGDFRNNGLTDLAVASSNFFFGDTIDVLLGKGDGTFQDPASISLGSGVSPAAIVAADFTGNGILDLATADANGSGTDDYSVLLGNGDGTFGLPTPIRLVDRAGFPPRSRRAISPATDSTDLAITRTSPDSLQVQLSNGDGTFSDPSVNDLVRRETPLVADVNGDGAPDVSVVDAAGDILFRAGRPGEPGVFAPPVTVNPGDPSRDIAFAVTNQGPVLISVDANDNNISFFALRSTGFVKVAIAPDRPRARADPRSRPAG